MIVLKVGGGKAIDVDAVVADVAARLAAGDRLVLVHGGAATTNEVATALGHPPRFVTSDSGRLSRRTDRPTLEIFEMVYCGRLNKMWVEKLLGAGVAAVGLAGLDGRIFEGRRKAELKIRVDGRRLVLRDDWTGTVERINVHLLGLLLDGGYLPVLTPPGASERGEAINVDGDRAAAALATALGAEALVLLSDVPGLLRDPADEATLVPRLSLAEVDRHLALANGRMDTKLRAAAAARRAGVARVVLADGRLDRPLERALGGEGTWIV